MIYLLIFLFTQSQRDESHTLLPLKTHFEQKTGSKHPLVPQTDFLNQTQNVLLFWNLISSRCMTVGDSRCVWLLVRACPLANNHLDEPDQRLSLRFRAAVLAGERRTITQRPQKKNRNDRRKNRLHNFSARVSIPNEISYTCINASIQGNLWCSLYPGTGLHGDGGVSMEMEIVF